MAINYDMAASMEWAYKEIRNIQMLARTGKPLTKPRWPMIILRTPKGWSGPAKLNGNFIEGSWRSHQVPLPDAAKDTEQFEILVKWLKSYGPEELFDTKVDSGNADTHDASRAAEGLISKTALRIIPKDIESRMGMLPESYKGYQPLELADWKEFGHEAGKDVSCMKAIGSFLRSTMEKNPKTFRIFSPDEITSNKLDEVLEITHRNFQWDPETSREYFGLRARRTRFVWSNAFY